METFEINGSKRIIFIEIIEHLNSKVYECVVYMYVYCLYNSRLKAQTMQGI